MFPFGAARRKRMDLPPPGSDTKIILLGVWVQQPLVRLKNTTSLAKYLRFRKQLSYHFRAITRFEHPRRK
jgi:hypothetical protein